MTTIFRYSYSCLWLLLFACSDPSAGTRVRSLDAPKLVQWYLPKSLREVSGLALVATNEVIAIQDERAKIYRLDIQTGEVLGRFSLGKPALKGDFEGVAVYGQHLYLLTSDGLLYRSDLSSTQDSRPYETFNLGLSKDCELEGLAHEPNTSLLWLVCKEIYTFAESEADDLSNAVRVRVHAWSIESQRLQPELTKHLLLPKDLSTSAFNPSGLAFTKQGERLLMIAARQSSYAWFDWSSDPKLLQVSKLPARGEHVQAEGVAIANNGMLIIADEGKKQRGKLSRYSELLE